MGKNIAIIGAGLAGLNCAKHLEQLTDANIDLYEKNQAVGGRIQTDKFDGFLLDHGFQVFLSKYPEAMKTFNYGELSLYPFTAGAHINGRYVGDPTREPASLGSTLLAPIGTMKDKLLILKMRFNPPRPKHNQTARELLKDYGFSEKIIKSFFQPFFSGVFLNRELENSAEFFIFLYQLFSTDYATLPKKGMQELPQNLAGQLKRTNIHLSTTITIKDSSTITLPNGEVKTYDHIISAHPPKNTEFYSVTTDYFWAKDHLPHNFNSASLALFTETKFINHVAPLSIANPHYAPEGKLLLSVNSLAEASSEEIGAELKTLYPSINFNFLKRYVINEALPKMRPQTKEKNSVISCGDFMETPSINGALASGRKTAEYIAQL